MQQFYYKQYTILQSEQYLGVSIILLWFNCRRLKSPLLSENYNLPLLRAVQRQMSEFWRRCFEKKVPMSSLPRQKTTWIKTQVSIQSRRKQVKTKDRSIKATRRTSSGESDKGSLFDQLIMTSKRPLVQYSSKCSP